MSKISIICPYLSGKGGTETVLSLISSHNKKRLNIEYVLPYKGYDKEWLSNAIYVDNNRKSKLKLLNKVYAVFFLASYVIKSKSSLYISLSTQFIFLLYIFRFLFRKNYKIISWIHFSLHHEKTVKPNKLFMADYHLAISSGIKKQLIDMGMKEDNIYLIYNPISPQKINNEEIKKLMEINALYM
ncbi:hypothetical protein [Pectobacterium parmentieri]|uniref:hypothetical protein n=1 Tax=Pectobacterium parmentieri TaxID=1905730 RepID=UPI0020314D8F|nr:hypothetical protein [Pectobacterium parmentieri]MCL6380568.1 hypothetical protein [Pectobacterium parmentieri]